MNIKQPPFTWYNFPGLPYRVRYYYDPVHGSSSWIEKRSLFGWRHVASYPTETEQDPWGELGKYIGVKISVD